MLTSNLIRQQESLRDLTEEQISTIETLSKNAENQVVKRIHDQYDADVTSITGNAKPPNTKSYHFLQSEMKRLKELSAGGEKIQTLQNQLQSLESEKAELQKELKNGSSDRNLKSQFSQLEQKLKDKENELNLIRTEFETEKTTLSEQLETERSKAVRLELTRDMDNYLMKKGVKFKSTIPETVLSEVLEQRKNSILQNVKPDTIEDVTGEKKRVLRGKEGEILINKQNGLNPFSAGELFFSKISDLIDEGINQTGTGTKEGKGSIVTALDLTSAKTQVQADEMIAIHIMQNEGLAKTNPKFAERQTEIRAESKVSELPIR